MKKLNKNKIQQEGVTLLLTVIITSMVMLIAVLIANIAVTQHKLSTDIGESTIAIYAADTGIEWQLYNIRQGSTSAQPLFTNGANIAKVEVTGTLPNLIIKSQGSYGEIRRELQVSF